MGELDDTSNASDTALTENEPIPQAAPAHGRSVWLIPALVGGIMAAAGLVAIGVFLGWRAGAHAPVAEPEQSVVTIAADPYAGKTSTVQMPDVRGLTKAEALTALSDAGIPGRLITVTTVPWAGTPDLVVDQTPLFGTSDPGAVIIRIATPAVIPAVIGKTEDDALTALEGLGVRVQVTRRYVPGTHAGIVLQVKPKPGSPVPDAVAVVISEDPGAIFLSQVRAIDGSCGGGGQVTVNGVDHANTTTCSAGNTDYPNVTTYSLRRGVQTIKGVIGIPDDADPAAGAKVTITLDGKPVKTVTVGYGKPVTVDLNTAGALRLTFTSVTTNPNVNGNVALADIVLTGDPAFITKLGQSQ